MATIVKVLGQLAPAAATLSTLYTTPAATSTVISTITAANTGSATALVRIAIRPGGAALDIKHYIAYDLEVPAHDVYAATFGITLATGDIVSVYSSTGAVSFSLFGEETS